MPDVKHDRHHPVAEPTSRAPEHGVDGRAAAVHAGPAAKLDHPRGQKQMAARRGHVNAAGAQRFAVLGMRSGQWPQALQDRGQLAPSLLPDVDRDGDGACEIGRECRC